MPNVDYSGGGGRAFRASVDGGIGSDGGAGGDYGWMMELARRRAEQKLRMGDLEYQSARGALHKANAPKLAGVDPYERQMKELAMRDAVARTDAMTGAAPVKFVSPMGTTGGFYTPDEQAMNAYQRQAFLPQGSSFTDEGASPSDYGRRDYARRRGAAQADEEGIASFASRLSRPGPSLGSLG